MLGELVNNYRNNRLIKSLIYHTEIMTFILWIQELQVCFPNLNGRRHENF